MALISQIFFCLLVAAIIGAIVGWLLKRLSAERERQALVALQEANASCEQLQFTAITTERDRWQLRAAEAEAKLATADAARVAALTAAGGHEAAVKDALATVRTRDGQLAEAQNALKAREAEVADKAARLTAALNERDALTAKHVALAPLPDRLHALETQLKEAQQNVLTLKSRLTKIDSENSDLHKRLITNESLPAQLADREQKLKLAEARLAEAQRLAGEQDQGLKRRADEAEKLRSELLAAQQQGAQMQAGRDADRAAHAGEAARLGAELTALALFKGKFDEATREKDRIAAELAEIKATLNDGDARTAQLAADLSGAREHEARLTAQLAAARDDIATLQRERDAKQQDYQALALTLSQQKAELSTAREEVNRVNTLLAEAPRGDNAMAQKKRAYDELARVVRSQSQEALQLRGEIARQESKLADVQAALQAEKSRRTAYAELARIVRTRGAEQPVVAKPPVVDRASEEKLAQRIRILEAENRASLGELAALKRAETPPQAAPVDAKPLPAWGAARPDKIDDLKLIWGVGPVLEKMLHDLGIFTFRQIARWAHADIKAVDAQLTVFHGRIERDHWVQGAREEHFKKYGERLS